MFGSLSIDANFLLTAFRYIVSGDSVFMRLLSSLLVTEDEQAVQYVSSDTLLFFASFLHFSHAALFSFSLNELFCFFWRDSL